MSRINVRRLTAVLVLAALLGLSVPAAAAPPSWPIAPELQGFGLMDRIGAWVAHLWSGEEAPPASKEKAKVPASFAKDPLEDRSGGLDPNGGC